MCSLSQRLHWAVFAFSRWVLGSFYPYCWNLDKNVWHQWMTYFFVFLLIKNMCFHMKMMQKKFIIYRYWGYNSVCTSWIHCPYIWKKLILHDSEYGCDLLRINEMQTFGPGRYPLYNNGFLCCFLVFIILCSNYCTRPWNKMSASLNDVKQREYYELHNALTHTWDLIWQKKPNEYWMQFPSVSPRPLCWRPYGGEKKSN